MSSNRGARPSPADDRLTVDDAIAAFRRDWDELTSSVGELEP